MKARNVFMYILGALIVAGIFTIIGLLIFRPMPPDNADLLNLTIGALLAAFGGVVNYFYGSSKGSADKNDLLKPPTP